MPGPMPPQGGPPQGPPSPDQGQAPEQGGGGNILIALDKAIDALAENVANDKSAPPEAQKLIQSIDQQFGQFMDLVKNGGGAGEPDGDEGPGQGQTVSPEAAGNKGAIPSPM